MAAPEHVPVDRNQPVRGYESPPRRPQPWLSDRPAEVVEDGQPRGQRLGNQGPDQGYMLSLARRFEGKLTLTPGEHEKDVLAGAVGVALKRASLFGRAPVVHDLTIALTIWGFLGDAPQDLVDLRKPLFEEAGHPHHYAELRRIVDLVSEGALRQTPAQVTEAHRSGWRSLLGELPARLH
ncbi:MAG: hypothetical protein ABIX10_12830 [Acidimicrobiales bacterium]